MKENLIIDMLGGKKIRSFNTNLKKASMAIFGKFLGKTLSAQQMSEVHIKRQNTDPIPLFIKGETARQDMRTLSDTDQKKGLPAFNAKTSIEKPLPRPNRSLHLNGISNEFYRYIQAFVKDTSQKKENKVAENTGGKTTNIEEYRNSFEKSGLRIMFSVQQILTAVTKNSLSGQLPLKVELIDTQAGLIPVTISREGETIQIRFRQVTPQLKNQLEKQIPQFRKMFQKTNNIQISMDAATEAKQSKNAAIKTPSQGQIITEGQPSISNKAQNRLKPPVIRLKTDDIISGKESFKQKQTAAPKNENFDLSIEKGTAKNRTNTLPKTGVEGMVQKGTTGRTQQQSAPVKPIANPKAAVEGQPGPGAKPIVQEKSPMISKIKNSFDEVKSKGDEQLLQNNKRANSEMTNDARRPGKHIQPETEKAPGLLGKHKIKNDFSRPSHTPTAGKSSADSRNVQSEIPVKQQSVGRSSTEAPLIAKKVIAADQTSSEIKQQKSNNLRIDKNDVDNSVSKPQKQETKPLYPDAAKKTIGKPEPEKQPQTEQSFKNVKSVPERTTEQAEPTPDTKAKNFATKIQKEITPTPNDSRTAQDKKNFAESGNNNAEQSKQNTAQKETVQNSRTVPATEAGTARKPEKISQIETNNVKYSRNSAASQKNQSGQPAGKTAKQSPETANPRTEIHTSETKVPQSEIGQAHTSNSVYTQKPVSTQQTLQTRTLNEMIARIREMVSVSRTARKNGTQTAKIVYQDRLMGKMEIGYKEQKSIKKLNIKVENESVRHELQKALPQITQMLQQKGIEVSSFRIDVGQFAQNEQTQEQKSQKKTNPRSNNVKEKGHEQNTPAVKVRKYGYNTMEVVA